MLLGAAETFWSKDLSAEKLEEVCA